MLYRLARETDAGRMCEIYTPYVEKTAITFADSPLTEEDFLHKIRSPYPVLVCEEKGRVLAYAYASRFREKEAYRWATELSLYVDENCLGRGMGRGLMKRLLALLQAQKFQSAWSCITLPNERSLSLHRAFRFREAGVFPNAGYKLGKWRDVTWLNLPLNPAVPDPEETLSVHDLPEATVTQLMNG